MNYFTGGYQGALNASAATNLPLPTGGTITTGTELIGIDLDCSQTGWGIYSGYRFGCQVGQAEHWRKV